ncbi:hypothetical protein TNCV_3389721 [Trichonephila clavipes]|nr:hypothetical protein TNCV_3389721 [Trichonephila clavipes]
MCRGADAGKAIGIGETVGVRSCLCIGVALCLFSRFQSLFLGLWRHHQLSQCLVRALTRSARPECVVTKRNHCSSDQAAVYHSSRKQYVHEPSRIAAANSELLVKAFKSVIFCHFSSTPNFDALSSWTRLLYVPH